MKIVEYNHVNGDPSNVFETLNRKIGFYKGRYKTLKIGITGRDPQVRFNEHLQEINWSRMVVIYEATSINYCNIMEAWLIDNHTVDLVNEKAGGASDLAKEGLNYVYVLLG